MVVPSAETDFVSDFNFKPIIYTYIYIYHFGTQLAKEVKFVSLEKFRMIAICVQAL